MMEPDKKAAPANEAIVIPVIEERVTVGTDVIETGRVQISKKVTEQHEVVNIPLLHEEHFIERIPKNEYVDEMPAIRQEGDTMIIPVLKEVMVKRTVLVEEIRITKHTIQTNELQQVTLRKEDVTVERVP